MTSTTITALGVLALFAWLVFCLLLLTCGFFAGEIVAWGWWRLRGWGHRRAVAAEWRAARRAWRAPWHAEPWAAYAHLARLEAQAQTRKERIA